VAGLGGAIDGEGEEFAESGWVGDVGGVEADLGEVRAGAGVVVAVGPDVHLGAEGGDG
jgi:hypothetical protein